MTSWRVVRTPPQVITDVYVGTLDLIVNNASWNRMIFHDLLANHSMSILPGFGRKRDRKRHTARRVASARYAALSPDRVRGVYPIQSWMGVGGTPSSPGQGGTTSSPGWGYPRVPPPLFSPGMGYPPPPEMWTDTCENSTFPNTSYVGGNDEL